MPLSHNAISRMIFFRNPINHPSVGFKRESILKLNGGYRHFPLYEDYDLWIRALFRGLRFKNLNKELVAVRICEQRKRRISLKNIISEFKLCISFFEVTRFHGFLFIPALIVRIIFNMLPMFLVNIFYSKLLRVRNKNEKISRFK